MKLTDTLLYTKIPEITDFSDWRYLKNVSDQMVSLMQRKDGMGLAANQVGIPLRLFVMQIGKRVYRVFNPRIISSENEQVAKEGCLSFPNKFEIKERPHKISATYVNWKDDNAYFEVFRGMAAVCFAHELDHLNGKTMYD